MNSTTNTDAPNATPTAPDSTLAAFMALILFPVAIYLSFWVIDWNGLIVPAVAFCVIVPSVGGSAVAAIARAARR